MSRNRYYIKWATLDNEEWGHLKLPKQDVYFVTYDVKTALKVADAFDAVDPTRTYVVEAV